MENVEKGIDGIKLQAAQVCEKHNLSFIGFFQNSSRSYERIIVEGMDCATPNGSFSSFSFNNISSSSEIQSALASLLNPNKIATSSPKNTASELNTSLHSYSSLSSSLSSRQKIYKTIVIDPHNKLDVKNYLYNCFEEFQQIPCKLLSKAWIKLIEPRKQSKYPYKQGDSSKPYWWPANCIHREPDHLKKDERISLLINILRIFKQRESELVYTASLIKGLGPSNNKITKHDDEFSQRRMNILEDMFRVVNAQNDFNVKSIKVIKPGKKYSSSIYQRHKAGYSNINTNTQKITKIAKPEASSIKFPDLLATPPSLKASSLIKNTNKLLPPLQFSNNYESYNEFMDCISNRSDSEKGGEFDNQSSNNRNPLLSSPFTPANLLNNKYPTPQYTNSGSTEHVHIHSLNPSGQNRGQKDNVNPLLYQKDSLIINEPAIDPTLFCNPLISSSNKNASPSKIFKPLECSASPPSGIFVPPKATSANNALNPLTTSRMNSMNSDLDRSSNKNCLFTTFPVIKHRNRRESLQDTKENGGDETDYE